MKLVLLICLFTIKIAGAAVYSVPVNENLKQYANFNLKSFRMISYDGDVVVKYKLPLELTGVEQKVEFSGTINPTAKSNVLRGENGTLICDKDARDSVTCSVEYKNLKFNEEKAIASLVQTSKNREELAGRIQVMRAFSSDPVGIITY